MPISFDKNLKLFHINNSRISYYFFVNEIGVLQHLYYGSRLDEFPYKASIDFGFDWSKTYLEPNGNEEKHLELGTYFSHSMFELGTSGFSDKRPSSAGFLNEKCDFRYVKHEVLKGKYNPSNLPHFKVENNECETLHITLKDAYKEIYLDLYYSIYEDSNAIIRNQKITNKEDSIILNRAQSLTLDLPRSDLMLTHFPGEWLFERKVTKELIKEGTKKVFSNTGRSSHEQNPFIFLSDIDANEEYGEVYGFSIVYSGSFSFEVNVNKWSQTRVTGGINDEDFSFELKKGESFDFPEGLLIYSNSGFGSMSRDLHDLIRNHLIRIPDKKIKESILLNSWEGCYLDFNTEKILKYVENCKKIGANLFVLDDGWFLNRNNDDRALGDWVVDEKKIDLKRVIDKCHELNIRFGLWFEPEMVNPNSNLYRNHKHVAVGREDAIRTLSRHQLCVDLVNKENRDLIFNQICKILDNYDIDYVKWDHNRTIDDPYSYALDEEHQNEFYHRNILGFYDLIQRFIDRYPKILFHGCASGGGRFDLGTMYYYPESWTSDETNPVQRLFIQYGTSFMYPFVTMGSHIGTNKLCPVDTKAKIALFGTYGIELDPSTLNDKEIEEIVEINKVFEKYHEKVISEGDLYRSYSPFESNRFFINMVSKDKTVSLGLFVNLLKETRDYRFLKFKGLDPNKKYKNNYDNNVYSGDFYMKVGINLTRWLDEFTTILFILEEVK